MYHRKSGNTIICSGMRSTSHVARPKDKGVNEVDENFALFFIIVFLLRWDGSGKPAAAILRESDRK